MTINIFAGEGKFGALYEKIISQNRECSYFYLFIYFSWSCLLKSVGNTVGTTSLLVNFSNVTIF